MNKIPKREYIIQEYINQHPDMSKLNPGSVNIIRIVTTRWDKDVHILTGALRIGAKKDSTVDNAAQGGTFVGINFENGTLREYGYYFDRPRDTKHPITGVTYNGYKIPYWEETIELVKSLHPYFQGLPVLGWDVAITPNGPIIIEANYDNCIKLIQMSNGGLRKRWYELKEK